MGHVLCDENHSQLLTYLTSQSPTFQPLGGWLTWEQFTRDPALLPRTVGVSGVRITLSDDTLGHAYIEGSASQLHEQLIFCQPKGRRTSINTNTAKEQLRAKEPQEAWALHHFAVCLFQVYREA